ncbi:pyridoxal-phosphate dependent enzyme [Rhodobacteraceae bacterium]|nr:pyridoxal-phosphate dependent enzyme [Paracoccaceae bacterium]
MHQSTFAPDPSRVQDLLGLCPAYEATPLVARSGLAASEMLLKDETSRMNLGSFKALGGVHAVYCLIRDAWERGCGRQLDPKAIMTAEVRKFAGGLTFVCASAGNHGLSVAAGAKLFGARAKIHLAKSVPSVFADVLREKGAEIVWSGNVYEQSMAAASKDAETSDAILLADGSWPDYVATPSIVMEGYTVMAEEMRRSFEASNQWPTHIALQAGVGGLAAAIACMVRRNWTVQPKLYVVEPEHAPCLGESHRAGRLVSVQGPVSNMGRLDCKEASMIAFEVLEQCDVEYVTISDASAQRATIDLKECGIKTTPSGAAGVAFFKGSRLGNQARLLAIISEGPVFATNSQ